MGEGGKEDGEKGKGGKDKDRVEKNADRDSREWIMEMEYTYCMSI